MKRHHCPLGKAKLHKPCSGSRSSFPPSARRERHSGHRLPHPHSPRSASSSDELSIHGREPTGIPWARQRRLRRIGRPRNSGIGQHVQPTVGKPQQIRTIRGHKPWQEHTADPRFPEDRFRGRSAFSTRVMKSLPLFFCHAGLVKTKTKDARLQPIAMATNPAPFLSKLFLALRRSGRSNRDFCRPLCKSRFALGQDYRRGPAKTIA